MPRIDLVAIVPITALVGKRLKGKGKSIPLPLTPYPDFCKKSNVISVDLHSDLFGQRVSPNALILGS